jgi:hypothetical protein
LGRQGADGLERPSYGELYSGKGVLRMVKDSLPVGSLYHARSSHSRTRAEWAVSPEEGHHQNSTRPDSVLPGQAC